MRLILLTALFLASPALLNQSLANQLEYKGGINHTYIRKSPPPTPEVKETKAEQETPTTKIWKKYKALARGQTQDEPAQKSSDQPTSPIAPAAPQKPTGMAAIIEQYQTNKSNRSQMRSISMTRPEAPNIEMIETPETPSP